MSSLTGGAIVLGTLVLWIGREANAASPKRKGALGDAPFQVKGIGGGGRVTLD